TLSIESVSKADNYLLKLYRPTDYVISPRIISFSIGSINANYDGTEKKPEILATNVISGDEIGFNTTYYGDNINVGYFTVRIEMLTGPDQHNYIFDAQLSRKTFLINKIEMPKDSNVFIDRTVYYNNDYHVFEVSRKFEGAVDTYSPTTTFKEIGVYEITATLKKANYIDVSLTAKLTILPGKHNINESDIILSSSETLFYGDSMPVLLDYLGRGTVKFEGSQSLRVGDNSYAWEFFPIDDVHYQTEKGNISLSVKKGKTEITANAPIGKNEGSIDPNVLSGIRMVETSGSIIIVFISSNGKTYTNLHELKPGNYTMKVSYIGNESYEGSEFETPFTLEGEPSYLWLIILGSAIGVLIIVSGVIISLKHKTKAKIQEDFGN
ncbi:MAG: hypothetical protein LBU04_06135, partial [Christensenellaceae bacterium]|nr:hypothetical protein [Christensenellaceae bacterium]